MFPRSVPTYSHLLCNGRWMHVILFEIRNILELVTQIIHIHKWNEENDLSRIKKILYIYIFTYSILSSKHRVYYYFCFYFLFSLFSMWTRGKEIVCVKKEKKLTFLFGTLDSAQPVVFSAGNSIDVRYRLQLRKLMLPRWLKIVIVSPLCILRVWHARLHLAGPNYILFSFRL